MRNPFVQSLSEVEHTIYIQCVYVCVYECVCVCMYVYMYVRMCMYVCMYACMYVYVVCMYIHLQSLIEIDCGTCV